ncbi:MAG: PAS domain S-box protein [Kiritimatiellae bacterium]|nr:PAS domain S-box protein [Kiritimatiellia bacterium]
MSTARILVAVRDPALVAKLQALLKILNYTTAGVADCASDAMRLAETLKPDLMLIDVRLEEAWQGIQVADAIHKQWQIPVIFLIDSADIEALQKAKAIDPIGFIRTPLDDNEVLATVKMALDKRWIERQLLESEQKYRSMMEAISDLVYICSPDCRVEYMNPAMIRKVGRDAVGEPCHRVFFDLTQVCPWCVMKQVQKGQSVHHEITNPRDGRIYRAASMPITHAGDTVSEMVILTDITEQRQAELALKESEGRYRRLVESTTDYIYTVKVENARAASTSHGPACVAVTGYTSAEYDANPNLWFNMVCEEDRKLVLDQADRLLKGETIQPLEHRIMHKNGKIRWLRNTPVPHHDSTGRLVSYDGLVSDITDRKLGELQIKEHSRKVEIVNKIIVSVNRATDLTALLDEVLNASRDLVQFKGAGIYIVDARATTAELVSIQGLPADYVRSLRQLQLNGPQYRVLFEQGQGIFADDYVRVAPEQARKWNIQSSASIPLTAKDTVIGALVLVHDAPHAFTGEEKELLVAVGRQIGTAIDKMRSELALRESEDKYRTISEQSLVGIHMIKDGKLVFVNDGWTKITGYDRDEIKTWGFEEFGRIVEPPDRSFFLDQIRKKQLGLTDGVVPVRDYRFLSKTGETKWVLLHSRSVQFVDGRAVIGVVIDITDRKLALQALEAANQQLRSREKELLAANRDKEVLLKEIHHRVKNNLQVISSLLKLQLGHVQDRQAAAVIRECQNRIKSIAIVHEKLYQSRSLAEVDIGNYIQSLISHLFRMFLVDPGSVTMDVAVDNVALHIDQAIPCSLIINELVSNALKYAFPDNRRGVIRIRLQAGANDLFRLEVGDNGVGFPSQVDFRNTASLGLQLVMTFVEQLGGSIERSPGPGTTFVVTFPAGKKSGS